MSEKQKTEIFIQQTEVKPERVGERVDSHRADRKIESPMFNHETMEVICERENLKKALKRVMANKGSAGADGMNVEELPVYLKVQWPEIKKQLLEGNYRPHPVRRKDIPKPQGKGIRTLGIPSVIDRFIQQAILQVLQDKWDNTFSESSYGFRPGRRAHQAIAKTQSYVREGYEWVVDVDLEKFFDRVNHDRLMSTLAKEISDKRLLKLIRAYLNAGMMGDGIVQPRNEGTPQGGPLSPFLSNIVLDELDKELEERRHRFVRYADDANIYVKTQRAGERVMKSLEDFINRRLKLRVNKEKSAVGKASDRKFLGFSLTSGKDLHRRRISDESIKRFKEKIRQLTDRHWRISFKERIEKLTLYLRGWRGYYGFCETPSMLEGLNRWIWRRLRCALWKEWKTCQNRRYELIKRGLKRNQARSASGCSHGPWKMSRSVAMHTVCPSSYFDSLGLPRLVCG